MTLWSLIPPDLQARLLAIPGLRGKRPLIPVLNLRERNEAIRHEHRDNLLSYGMSAAESVALLATRYPLCERRIRQILGESGGR